MVKQEDLTFKFVMECVQSPALKKALDTFDVWFPIPGLDNTHLYSHRGEVYSLPREVGANGYQYNVGGVVMKARHDKEGTKRWTITKNRQKYDVAMRAIIECLKDMNYGAVQFSLAKKTKPGKSVAFLDASEFLKIANTPVQDSFEFCSNINERQEEIEIWKTPKFGFLNSYKGNTLNGNILVSNKGGVKTICSDGEIRIVDFGWHGSKTRRIQFKRSHYKCGWNAAPSFDLSVAVLTAFGKGSSGLVDGSKVIHLDGDFTNCSLDNLAWKDARKKQTMMSSNVKMVDPAKNPLVEIESSPDIEWVDLTKKYGAEGHELYYDLYPEFHHTPNEYCYSLGGLESERVFSIKERKFLEPSRTHRRGLGYKDLYVGVLDSELRAANMKNAKIIAARPSIFSLAQTMAANRIDFRLISKPVSLKEYAGLLEQNEINKRKIEKALSEDEREAQPIATKKPRNALVILKEPEPSKKPSWLSLDNGLPVLPEWSFEPLADNQSRQPAEPVAEEAFVPGLLKRASAFASRLLGR